MSRLILEENYVNFRNSVVLHWSIFPGCCGNAVNKIQQIKNFNFDYRNGFLCFWFCFDLDLQKTTLINNLAVATPSVSLSFLFEIENFYCIMCKL